MHGELGWAQFHLWFPNMKFNVLPGHAEPVDRAAVAHESGDLRGYLDYWFADTADQKWIDDCFELDTRSAPRTPALVEAAQRGSLGGDHRPGLGARRQPRR